MLYYVIIILMVIFRFILKTVSASLSILEGGRYTYDIDDDRLRCKVDAYKAKSGVYIAAASLTSVIIILFSGIMTYRKLMDILSINEGLFYTAAGELSPWGYLAFLVTIILLSFIFALIGGSIPRNIAVKNPVWYIVTFGFILKLISAILYPLVHIMNVIGSRLSSIELDPDDFEIEEDTQDEIQQLLTSGEETGTIDETEKEMIENVFELDNTTAEDIFTHRRNIVALPVSCSIEDIREVILYEKYTRIPVYEENIDNIIGILNIKDFARYYIKRNRSKFNIRRLLKPTFYVPINKKVGEIFEQMQATKIHLAVVVDEYGGTLGIVTMEDIVEEVMGDILDEYDTDEKPEIIKNDDGSFTIDGKADIEDVEDELEIEELPDGDIDTIGGYMISLMGYIPDDDSSYEFEHDGWLFKTEKIENRRIVLINAKKLLSKSDNHANGGNSSGEESPGSAEQNAG